MKTRILSLVLVLSMVLTLFAGLSLASYAEADTIAYWAGTTPKPTNGVIPDNAQANNASAVFTPSSAITSKGTGNSVGSCFGTWTSEGTITISNLSLEDYTDITLQINLRKNNATVTAKAEISSDGSNWTDLNDNKSINNDLSPVYWNDIPNTANYIRLTIGGAKGSLWVGDTYISGTYIGSETPHEHSWDEGVVISEPTCTEAGTKNYTCTICGTTKTEAIDSLGHDFVDGTCSRCGVKVPVVDAEYILTAEKASKELSSFTTSGTIYGIGNEYSSTPEGRYKLTVEAGSVEGTYAFKNDSNYLTWSDGNSLSLSTTKDANSSWTVEIDEDNNAVIKNAADSTRQIWWNVSSPRFACYTGKTAGNDYYAVQLVKAVTDCIHENTETIAAKDSTCTEQGNNAYVHCLDCGKYFTDGTFEQETSPEDMMKPFVAHADANGDGSCDMCMGKLYTKVTGLTNGEKLVIYHPGSGTAITSTASGTRLESAAVSATNNQVAVTDASGIAVFTVEFAENSTEYFYLKCGENYLTTGATGNSLTLAAKDNDYSLWRIETKDSSTLLVNANAANNENPIAVEYYKGNFNGYSWTENSDQSLYQLELYTSKLIDIYIVDQTDSLTNFYAWGPSNNNGDFPGAKLPNSFGTDMDNHPVYKISLDKDVYSTGLIFAIEEGKQSGDLGWIGDYEAHEWDYIVYFVKDDGGEKLYVSAGSDDFWLASTKNEVAPTCTEAGYTEYTGYLTARKNSVEGAPATGHTAGAEWQKNGKQHWKLCSVCHEIIEDTVDEHKYVDGVCICGRKEDQELELNGKYVIAGVKADNTTWELTGVADDIGTASSYVNYPTAAFVVEVVAGIETDAGETVAFKTSDNKYLAWTEGNSLSLADEVSESSSWKWTSSEDLFTIANAADSTRILQFNANTDNERFACYKGTQKAVKLIPYDPGFAFASLSLEEGVVKLNFYTKFVDPSEFTVKLEGPYNDKNENLSAARLDETSQGYRVQYPISYKDYEEVVTATLYKGDEIIATKDYSVKDYLTDEFHAGKKQETLVNSLYDLCRLVEATVGKQTAVPEGVSVAAVEPDTANNAEITGTGNDTVTYYGSSLLMRDEIVIRHYFTFNGSAEGYTAEGGELTRLSATSKYYYVDVSNIGAKNLSTKYTVVLKDADGNAVYTINYSALSYANKVISSEQADPLLSTAYALYAYNAAAVKYFN